jgi:hypothetical protein
MVKYVARRLDTNRSGPEKLIYQYKPFLCEGNSASARKLLNQGLEDLFLDANLSLIDFRPLGQKSWRSSFMRNDISDNEYPVTFEEYEEEHPITRNCIRFVIAAFIQTVPEDYGRDGFYTYRYLLAPSLKEAIEKTKRTYEIELCTDEGSLDPRTLRIKTVGRNKKWHQLEVLP